ncbi:unnamed protein product [Rhodiola kirilowii]
MGVYTFICRSTGKDWSAKQLSGDLEASAATPFELQRKLVQSALSSDSGAVQSSFSHVTPSSAVFQVIVGGAVGGASFGSGPAAASAPSGGAAAAAPAAEEKKEEKEESDDDMGFSLFD